MKVLLILAVLGLLCVRESSQRSSNKLKVSLYYEALCPWCFMFINLQLYPSYQKIGSSLLLDLVPYGNARRTKVNGTWHIDCQHGPTECALNKVEACGLSKSPDQDKDIAFVNCVEKQSLNQANVKIIVDACAPILGLTADTILQCSQGDEGTELLVRLGQKTDAVQPKLKGVPHVIFNDKNDDTLDVDARKDFLGTACKLMLHKPKGCPGSNEIPEIIQIL